jgi:hypothetical protein
MFKESQKVRQINMDDQYHSFPKYVREALHNSWAEFFFEHIFRNIDESQFSVLYSENYSRPNAPVNLLVGLLFLKELNCNTDEELIGSLYFDYRVQYALGITDFDKERICINTIGNFRKRLVEYAEATGEDLFHQEVASLSEKLAEVAEMDTSLARQDSMMISANCKRMGRMELFYTVNANVVKALNKHDENLLPETCQHYLRKDDKNDHIYRTRNEDAENKLQRLLRESVELLQVIPESLKESTEYNNLIRLLSEQTETTDDGGWNLKDGKDLSAKSLQNPSEPDATFRRKGKKDSIGYALNFVEARDEKKNLGLILHHEQQQNSISDVEFGNNTLEAPVAEKVKYIANDGGYFSSANIEKANSKGIKMSFSALTGKKEVGISGICKFEIDEDIQRIVKCPAGHRPKQTKYNEGNQTYSAKFPRDLCEKCPMAAQCPIKRSSRYNQIKFTRKKYITDLSRCEIGTEEHIRLSRFRAGVEGVPSVLRRMYNIDRIPVRGLNRSRIWVDAKIMAYNFRAFYAYCRRSGLQLLADYFIKVVWNCRRMLLAN